MSDNYYVLLGLDPSADDWTIIESAIQDRRRKWSIDKMQGSPTDRRQAVRYLPLIPDMETKLRDPETRQTIAREAEKELKEETVQQMARLNELIDVIRDATIEPDDVKLLVRQIGEGLTEAEVVARLKARGIMVGPTASTQDAPKVRPKLDPTMARAIRDNLRYIKKSSLYDFLGIGPRSSPRLLFDTADETLIELLRTGLRDTDSNNRQELAGQCKVVFKNSEEKERYDNTYAAETMGEFDGRLEVAGRRGFLDYEDIDRLVRATRTKGVGQDIALEYIEDYAHRRKWDLRWRRDSASPRDGWRSIGHALRNQGSVEAVSDNYYILLGLDTSVDDWPTIELAIQDRRRAWSRDKNQGSPTARREAERYLTLIPDIEAKLRDPQERRAIALEAQKELKKR